MSPSCRDEGADLCVPNLLISNPVEGSQGVISQEGSSRVISREGRERLISRKGLCSSGGEPGGGGDLSGGEREGDLSEGACFQWRGARG